MSGEPLIVVEHLSKVYAPSSARTVRALDDVSFTIERGAYVAIVGESGSGKTTLMHLLGGLDRPSAGTIAIGGRRLDLASRGELAALRARMIGFVFQDFSLIPTLDAAGNVALAARYAGRSREQAQTLAQAALADVGLAERLHHRPLQLSGGQQQRVAIARALVNAPALLLADEPTGELDSKTGEAILTLFDALSARDQTIVVVTHSAAVWRRAGRVIRLEDGKITEDASFRLPADPRRVADL